MAPEFREIRPILWPFSQAPKQGDLFTPNQADKLRVPTGSTILLPQKGKAKARPTQVDREKSIQVGIFHTPEEFTDKACRACYFKRGGPCKHVDVSM